MTAPDRRAWPRLPAHGEWAGTLTTLHMLTQAIGKIRTACAPPVNHWWQSTLCATPRGLTTSAMPHGSRTFQIDVDLIGHRIVVAADDGAERAVALGPRPVADHYRELMAALAAMGLAVELADPVPNEVEEAIPFAEDDVHRDYVPDHADAFRRALLQAHRVLSAWRGPFVGKASPVHFFWGGFDLAVTRFSGRRAPVHPGGVPRCPDWVQEEAYSHECSSAGWWPLGEGGASFYSYMYPEPEGFPDAAVRPGAARYERDLGEFLLRWDDVLAAPDPDAAVLDFCRSTYEAGADLAGWNRRALEPAAYPADPPPSGAWSTTAADP